MLLVRGLQLWLGTLLILRSIIPSLMAIIASLLLLRRILSLLRVLKLRSAFLLGTLVKRGCNVLQSTNEMMAKVPFRFMGYFDGFGNSLDSSSELIKGVLDSLEAVRYTAKKLVLGIRFRWDHR
jgi:hypothetical protein